MFALTWCSYTEAYVIIANKFLIYASSPQIYSFLIRLQKSDDKIL